ncbi:MAG: zinc-ribbon domain-containing protein [Anaerolineae bacterium]|nr:zinc-ribbon domain-containing protein [Anaerolineae bacterium]
MTPAPQCPKCGAVLRAGATFCGKCGTDLTSDSTTEAPKHEPGKCPTCGRDVDENWRACPHCSTKLIFECPKCGKRAEQHWKVCPYCETELSLTEKDADRGDKEDS